MPHGMIAVVCNPTKVADVPALRQEAHRRAAAAGLHLRWYETTVDDPGGGQARAAAAEGCELVIACGGDGTVAACAGALAGTPVRLGIVAAGTGNLLARGLGLPAAVTDALDVAFTGPVRHIDVLDAGTQRFVVMAGVGFDAELIRDTNEHLKATVGWAAYLGGFAKAVYRTRAARFTITVDDSPPIRRRAIGVLVANLGVLRGGIALLPAAQPDDGILDVIVLSPRRIRGWLTLAARIVTRRPRNDRHSVILQGRRVLVTANRGVPAEYDGDYRGQTTRLAVTLLPAALAVHCPIPD